MADQPLGVVLAGGAGQRIGGGKAGVVLGGRSLLAWVASALWVACGEVVVAAKEGVELPELGELGGLVQPGGLGELGGLVQPGGPGELRGLVEPGRPGELRGLGELGGLAVWREPVEPVHPLAGIAWALERADGRDLLVAAVDLPFCADAVRAVAAAAAADGPDGRDAGIVIAAGQPLLGVYRPSVAGALRDAVSTGRPARAVVAELGAVAVAVPSQERTLFNLNTPEDLAAAEAMLAGD